MPLCGMRAREAQGDKKTEKVKKKKKGITSATYKPQVDQNFFINYKVKKAKCMQ